MSKGRYPRLAAAKDRGSRSLPIQSNYAVRLEEGEITRIFREDDTVKEILTVLAASGNKVACHNLGVFHLKRGEKKEADKYFDKAQKPAASVGR